MERCRRQSRDVTLALFAEDKPHHMPEAVCKHQHVKSGHQRQSEGKGIEEEHADPQGIKKQLKGQEEAETHPKRREAFMKAGREFF